MNGADGPGTDLSLRPARDPLEFLSRSWSASAADVSRALAAKPHLGAGAIAEDVSAELDGDGGAPASGSSFCFASAATSQLIFDRIMAPSVRSKTAFRFSGLCFFFSPSFLAGVVRFCPVDLKFGLISHPLPMLLFFSPD
jgi:hypothetical protein